MVRKIAHKFLTEFGFQVEEAENGEEALEKCRRSMPKLILLDWNMPVMNGLDFLVNLRAGEHGSLPVVVFCTTESDVDHILTGLEAGADDYLIKPFDRESLYAKVESVKNRRADGSAATKDLP